MKESRNVNQANGNALINAADISRHYTMADGTVQALSNVSLTVNVGEFIAITGPSGSGKSTLMNILGLLDTCDSGTYMFSGLDTKTLADNELSRIRNERIGFIFQSFNLIPTLSVVENVALPLTYRGIPTAKRLERSLSALEAVGLSGRLSHNRMSFREDSSNVSLSQEQSLQILTLSLRTSRAEILTAAPERK